MWSTIRIGIRSGYLHSLIPRMSTQIDNHCRIGQSSNADEYGNGADALLAREQPEIEDGESAKTIFDAARALLVSGQPVEALRLMETMPEHLQQSGRGQLLRSRAYMKTGDAEQAQIALDAAARAGVPEKVVLEALSAFQEQMNDHQALQVTLAKLVELDPQNPALLARMVRNLKVLGRAEDALNAARARREMIPEDPTAHGLACNVAVHFGDITAYKEALEYALAHLSGPLPPSAGALNHLRMMSQEDIGTIPARVEARWPGSLSLRETKCVNPAPQQTWRRPLVQPKPEGALLCSPPGDTGITIVWFGGMAHNDFKTHEAIDSHAAAAGCNAIYVRDPERANFRPVDRTDDPLTALLRAEIARFDTQKLVFCGVSIGAYAAFFYGVALDADRLISLSGPTSGHPDQRAEMGDRRAPMVIASLLSNIPLEQLDLRPAILAASMAKRRTPFRYDIYFGADRLTDRRHAERVADIPGVQLFPLEGFAQHLSFTALVDRGRTGEIFTA